MTKQASTARESTCLPGINNLSQKQALAVSIFSCPSTRRKAIPQVSRRRASVTLPSFSLWPAGQRKLLNKPRWPALVLAWWAKKKKKKKRKTIQPSLGRQQDGDFSDTKSPSIFYRSKLCFYYTYTRSMFLLIGRKRG